MSDVVNIGLPFFDSINKQVRMKPFFMGYLAQWKGSANRILPFQLNVGATSGIVSFDLINSVTGTTTDYLAYFTANTLLTEVDLEYYYTHLSLVDVTVTNGRYYFHAIGAGGGEWWSEEFVMCDGVEEESAYLLIDDADYLLIGTTDRLYIR